MVYQTEKQAILSGIVPQPPLILCRDEETAALIRASIHTDLSKLPPVEISEHWPKHWNYAAVVYIPIDVLGTAQRRRSFAIREDMSDLARQCLDEIIRWKRTNDGNNPTLRDIAKARGISRRQAGYGLKELEELRLIIREGRGEIRTNFGSWMPDEKKAKEKGIEILVYE